MLDFGLLIYLRGIGYGYSGATKVNHQAKQVIGHRPSEGLGHDRRRLTTRADHHKTQPFRALPLARLTRVLQYNIAQSSCSLPLLEIIHTAQLCLSFLCGEQHACVKHTYTLCTNNNKKSHPEPPIILYTTSSYFMLAQSFPVHNLLLRILAAGLC